MRMSLQEEQTHQAYCCEACADMVPACAPAASSELRSGMAGKAPHEVNMAVVRSGHRAGHATSTAPAAATLEADAAPVFFASQQSQDAPGRKRKASFVQEPVRQGPGRPHERPAAPARQASPPHKVRRSQRSTTRRLTAMQA